MAFRTGLSSSKLVLFKGNHRCFSTSGGGFKFGRQTRAGAVPGTLKEKANPNQYAPQEVPPGQPPVEYYQQQPPQTLGQSVVQYGVLGFGLAIGIGMVRMVFGEPKMQEDLDDQA